MTITMYGADWCGDYRRAKAWFEERRIECTYVDLADAPDEVDRVLERGNGVKKIPVIVFPDGSHLIEPSNDELSAHVTLLADAGIGLTAVSAAADDDRLAVVENSYLGRFELLQHGCVVSFATYTSDDGSITVPHVETDPEHRGNGHAAQLMEGLLAIIRADGRTITPRCPFAAAHISDNEQHHDLVAA
jgi:predicted GNAT family acetyltransferase/glutaredoxin-related protein